MGSDAGVYFCLEACMLVQYLELAVIFVKYIGGDVQYIDAIGLIASGSLCLL